MLWATLVQLQSLFQWIGLRENLQETMAFTIKYRVFMGFPVNFPIVQFYDYFCDVLTLSWWKVAAGISWDGRVECVRHDARKTLRSLSFLQPRKSQPSTQRQPHHQAPNIKGDALLSKNTWMILYSISFFNYVSCQMSLSNTSHPIPSAFYRWQIYNVNPGVVTLPLMTSWVTIQ